MLKAELSRDRDCPICGGRWAEPLFIKAGFPHGRCPECGLIYVNPVLGDQAALEHYRDETSWVRVLESGPQVEFDRLKYEYGLDAAEPYLEGSSLLDVGTGTGLFLKVAQGRGYAVSGLELNAGGLDRLRAEGFTVIDRPLEEAGLEANSFDLITLWEVLEHIVEPMGLAAEVARILKQRGVLLILVPNADSLASRILHEKSGAFGGHSHVNFFNRKTLTRLLEDAGFEILEAETLITELGTINNYLSFEDPYLGRADAVLDFLTPEFIHGHMLGSKLLVLARPNSNKEQSA